MSTLAQVENLSEREAKELLAYLLHHMSTASVSRGRADLGRRYPQHYNKLVGRPIVKVVRAGDGSRW